MKNKITTKEIEIALARHLNWRQNIIVPNISWGFAIHECDILVVTPRGYCTEIEIKVSITDLKKDLEKKHKHIDKRIKEFYFAMPDYMVEKSLEYVPERAGILSCCRWSEKTIFVKTYRKALPDNHTIPLTLAEQFKIAKLGCMRIWNLKNKIYDLNNKGS